MSYRTSKGAALLALLALFLVIATTTFISSKSRNTQNIDRRINNNAALNAVREALVGYALRQSPPGLLPCPDTDGDGIEDRAAVCNSQLGFVPYQTLQLPDTRDAAAQRLWYGVELDYTQEVGGVSLNSSLPSALTINGAIATAAVVIAPGEAIGGQTRNNNNVNQFLEGLNSNGNETTYENNPSDTNNDEVLGVSLSEFWTTIERRVVFVVEESLLGYRAQLNCGVYPWAADNAAPYDSANNLDAGVVPIGATLPAGGGAGCPANLTLPGWFDAHWVSEIHYATCEDSDPLCIAINGDLIQTVDALTIAPGIPLAGQMRPDVALNQYFEDDNNDGDLNFLYVSPKNHDSVFNDVLHAITP